jgi:hypothetical protein
MIDCTAFPRYSGSGGSLVRLIRALVHSLRAHTSSCFSVHLVAIGGGRWASADCAPVSGIGQPDGQYRETRKHWAEVFETHMPRRVIDLGFLNRQLTGVVNNRLACTRS